MKQYKGCLSIRGCWVVLGEFPEYGRKGEIIRVKTTPDAINQDAREYFLQAETPEENQKWADFILNTNKIPPKKKIDKIERLVA